ncbi:MAG: peptidase S8 and S53 subtilisin kexin sedolisin, partial [Coleofasciculaceae cyanobacterium SM2_1_6]|nr:peptidase S8 and S53 subtilisin kexin sedolisin [Coleofasciculaceae cyanobacterium SM2_1_6]
MLKKEHGWGIKAWSKQWSWIGLGLGALCLVVLPSIFLPSIAATSLTSMDETGVDALRVHSQPYDLQGRKVAIGQVEIGRPGIFGFDKVMAWNPPFNVAQTFLKDQPARANQLVDTHAFMVAGVMVSRDKGIPGVAPLAQLYSGAVGSPRSNGQPEMCLASQHVASQNGGDVRSINFSFGEPLARDPRPNAALDGNALLTQCIDWSARV